MGYESLFAPCDLAMLYDWLEETGELYLDLDRPHSGGANNSLHFVRNLAELRIIVSNEKWPEVDISVFRAKQYPVRGLADEKLWRQPWNKYRIVSTSLSCPRAPIRSRLAASSDGAAVVGSFVKNLPGSKDDKFGLDKIPSTCLLTTTSKDSSTVRTRC